jgi:hypothetical protein
MRCARDGNMTGEGVNRESVKRRARRGPNTVRSALGAARLGKSHRGGPMIVALVSRTRLGFISAISLGLAEQA